MKNIIFSIKRLILFEKCKKCKCLLSKDEKYEMWNNCYKCSKSICLDCTDLTILSNIKEWLCFKCSIKKYPVFKCYRCNLSSPFKEYFPICDRCKKINKNICIECTFHCDNIFFLKCDKKYMCPNCCYSCFGCGKYFCIDCLKLVKINRIYRSPVNEDFCNTCLNDNRPKLINFFTKRKITSEIYEN